MDKEIITPSPHICFFVYLCKAYYKIIFLYINFCFLYDNVHIKNYFKDNYFLIFIFAFFNFQSAKTNSQYHFAFIFFIGIIF